jgi:two-component system sensor histidine kinase KdpD
VKIFRSRKLPSSIQFFISIVLIAGVSLVCFSLKEIIGYKIVALLLLLTVSIIAISFEILPVLLAATLSAVIWNFFFIPPIYTFHINDGEDLLMFLSYFSVSLINAVLTSRIRRIERKAQEKEEKENTIKLYNTLLNSLSHELKTPLSTIIAAVDTLKDNHIHLSKIKQQELLNEIDIATLRLNKHVENLLSMSHIETGLFSLHKEWCDLNEFINMLIQSFSLSTKGRQIIFVPDDNLPLCKIDIGIMEQAVQNIIANAILYTPSHTIITIKVAVLENELIIIIQDNGNGIPDELLDKIFNKFYRIPDTQTGGTGLGLSITKGFIEAHNGTIIAKNILPHGLGFEIKIPVETTYINHLKNE